MEVNVYYDKSHWEYIRFTISTPHIIESKQSVLSELQEKDSIVTPQCCIFDVRSDNEKMEIDVIVRANIDNLGQVIVFLKKIESNAWGNE